MPPIGNAQDTFEAAEHVTSILQRIADLSRPGRAQKTATTENQHGLSIVSQPDEPFVDIVFVHSLWGSAVNTWSENRSAVKFWPKFWLPFDRRFAHARISVYGYMTDDIVLRDPSKTQSEMEKISDDLLQELKSSLSPNDENDYPRTSIILVGHGIGGLIIKKLYLLASKNARKDGPSNSLLERLRHLVFLATPHNEANDENVYADMYKASRNLGASGDQSNPLDPTALRTGLQSTNNDFRDHLVNLTLHSFFDREANAMFGPEKATMSNRYEKRHSFTGGFAAISQFESPLDKNYEKLVQVLADIVKELSNEANMSTTDDSRNKKEKLKRYLGYKQDPQRQILAFEQNRSPETCKWILLDEDFRNWKYNHSRRTQFYWLKGPPTAGKSVISAYIVHHLRNLNRSCSHYFFNDAGQSRSQVALMLRSLAYQMAVSNRTIRSNLLSLEAGDIPFDKDDALAVWSTVFVGCIFDIMYPESQYWVIDALDECNDDDQRLLFGLFKKLMDHHLPFCIFFTSRNLPHLQDQFNETIATVHDSVERHIRLENTESDIRKYLTMKKNTLLVDEDDGEMEDAIEKLVQKSEGSFLWVSLVIEEIRESANGPADMIRIIDSLPKGMFQFYKKMEGSIRSDHAAEELVNKILPWVLCAKRPLKVNELSEALHHETTEPPNKQLQKVLERRCGQLVKVDEVTKEVKMVHTTAKEFFLRRKSESQATSTPISPTDKDSVASSMSGSAAVSLCAKEADCNAKIAVVCLKCMLSKTSLSQPGWRARETAHRTTTEFTDYACVFFSHHLKAVSRCNESNAREALTVLVKFLKAKTLAWLEVLFKNNDLKAIIQTSRNLKEMLTGFGGMQDEFFSPEDHALVAGWANDLVHIVVKFGGQLCAAPWAIHYLVAPLCPTDTMISQCFGRGPAGLVVSGLQQVEWEDQLACITHGQQTTDSAFTALAVCQDKFAIAQASGHVTIYDTSNCQESVNIPDIGDKVLMAAFGRSSHWLAVGIRRNVFVYRWTQDENGFSTYRQEERMVIGHEPLAIAFSHDDQKLYAVTKGSVVHVGNLSRKEAPDVYPLPEPIRGQGIGQPEKGAFLAGQRILALGYRGLPTQLWDLEQKVWMKSIPKSSKLGVVPSMTSITFHPDQERRLLIASFQDGDVMIFDTTERRTEESANRLLFMTQCLAISADGRKLACLNGDQISLFDFESLTLIHQIPCPWYPKYITFGAGSDRLFAFNDEKCVIWEPAKLLTTGSASSYSEISSNQSTGYVRQESGPMDSEPYVSVMVYEASGESKGTVFYGTENAVVYAKDLIGINGPPQQLYSHGMFKQVALIAVSHTHIASADRVGHVLVHQKSRGRDGRWKVPKRPVLDMNMKHLRFLNFVRIQGQHCLVYATETNLYGWNIDNPTLNIEPLPFEPGTFTTIENHTQLTLINEKEVYQYNPITRQKKVSSLPKTLSMLLDIVSKELSGKPRAKSYECIHALLQLGFFEDMAPQTLDELKDSLSQSWPKFVRCQRRMIGVKDERVVFLDWQNWICSIDVDGIVKGKFKRHFFLPLDWVTTNQASLIQLISGGLLLVGKDVDIVMVQNGLTSGEDKTWASTTLI